MNLEIPADTIHHVIPVRKAVAVAKVAANHQNVEVAFNHQKEKVPFEAEMILDILMMIWSILINLMDPIMR
jgi:hypothetical protein